MRPLVLALSFIRVPRLFVSLLLWPLLIGLFLLSAGIVFSASYLKLLKMDEATAERTLAEEDGDRIMRDFIYGDDTPPERPKLCVWIAQGAGEIMPPDCVQDSADPVIRVADPATYDAGDYMNAFAGAVHRVHVCKSCSGDINIDPAKGRSDLRTLQALGIFALVDQLNFKSRKRLLVESVAERRKLERLEGNVLFQPRGRPGPVNISETQERMIVVVNVAFLIIIALWLALKAHGKVLDYFAKNGALLPLVAACGKNDFYAALWIITLVRVGFFLAASVPASLIVLSKTLSASPAQSISSNIPEFCAWLLSLVLGLGSLTIIGSIADLKQRQSWTSFLYRYVPVFCCIAGGSLWISAVLRGGPAHEFIQHTIASLPVVGLTPILLSPIFRMDLQVMLAHSIMSFLLIAVTLRANARWFASHLEEI